MDQLADVVSIQELSELAGLLRAISSKTPIKVYYESSDLLLKNAQVSHESQNIDVEYYWLMRFVILIYERMQTHEGFKKTTEAHRLDKVYKGKCRHVLNRLETLKSQLIVFYDRKAQIISSPDTNLNDKNHSTTKKHSSTVEDPKTLIENMKKEDPLFARLSRLSETTTPPKPTEIIKKEEIKALSPKLEAPVVEETPKTENLISAADLDFLGNVGPKQSPLTSNNIDTSPNDDKLIPDVEIVDKTALDLAWLEEDPIFGPKAKSGLSSNSSPVSSSSSSNGSLKHDSDVNVPEQLPDWITQTFKTSPVKKDLPPSYSAAKLTSSTHSSSQILNHLSSSHCGSEGHHEDGKRPNKYKISTTQIETSLAPSNAYSAPSLDHVVSQEEGFSFTKTNRGHQFDPTEVNKKLLTVQVTATCGAFTDSGASSSSPSASVTMISSDMNELMPSLTVLKDSNSSQAPKPISSSSPNNLAASPNTGSFPNTSPSLNGSSQHILYQPSPNLVSRMPMVRNAPVVFRPGQLNIFDPSKHLIQPSGYMPPSSGYIVPSTGYMPTSSANIQGIPAPSSLPAPSKPPKYVKPKSSQLTSAAGLPNPPPYKPSSKPSSSYKLSHNTPSAAYKPSQSPFPLLTNQRPGEATEDWSLKRLEIDGEIFDKFMSAAHRNTSRNIETCGILAGKLIVKKDIFRVTHLIIPKQTGTTDTCATTNEDEIFEFQIKHDLLTLGWIHTHPTQACFLSSVDLHTHASYQSLFPEAVAIVIAPRDIPSFSFFHLSKAGLPLIQGCPRKGFHHHPERGLYEACAHVTMSWASKRPCKIIDMR